MLAGGRCGTLFSVLIWKYRWCPIPFALFEFSSLHRQRLHGYVSCRTRPRPPHPDVYGALAKERDLYGRVGNMEVALAEAELREQVGMAAGPCQGSHAAAGRRGA